MHDQDHEDDENIVSKSQRKRESTALQDLGEELFELSRDQLKKMDLPDSLLSALLEAKRLTPRHEAMRRQMQYVGKVMRNIETEPIDQQLAVIRGESNIAKAAFHGMENWRTRLIENDSALNEWLALHPDTDVQQIRQLIRNARKEAAEAKPPKSSRALFKLIREHSERTS
ncbi:MAG: ribosome biogenesis factor YjgA [Pseudomonadota bacterium]|nr:ribosome biogenesis factor YjgA [Pseudomonadota bacterium]